MAIIPAETFHHHDFESEVCQESAIHFADHAVDCELASHYTPAFEQSTSFEINAISIVFQELSTGVLPHSKSSILSLYLGRAPPALT